MGIIFIFLLTFASKGDEMKTNKMLNGKRIIYNNDGGDADILNSRDINLDKEKRIENFLEARTKPLLRTGITTIFYCTGTVGLCSHNSKVASVILHPSEILWREDREKDIQSLMEKRIDPLRVIVDFCRKNNLEIFWSLRMNDIHDSSEDKGSKFIFEINKFKQTHKECLIGLDPWPTFGRPTSVDYTYSDVREMVYKMVEEVCKNYDIGGVHLDFYRHPIFFRDPAFGIHASKQQLDMMTDLIRKIKKMMDTVEKEKKNKLLLAIRVPDSIEYCKVIGLDIETWLKDKLIDLLIVGGYTQFNRWKYFVDLGHKYKTKVYIDLSESRTGDGGIRNTPESYRARSYDAWVSGADGFHLFNFFTLNEEQLNLINEMSNPEKLDKLDKIYFADVLGPKIGWASYPTSGYRKIPTITPNYPMEIKLSQNAILEIMVSDNLDKQKIKPHCKLKLLINDIQEISKKLNENFIIFYFGGIKLEKPEIKETTLPVVNDKIKVLEYDISAQTIKSGLNQLEIVNRGENIIKLYDFHLSIKYEKKASHDRS